MTMAKNDPSNWISIPTELIGSIPRTNRLNESRIEFESDLLTIEQLKTIEKESVEEIIHDLTRFTDSPVLTDGEQTKPSFLTYPIYGLIYEQYKFDEQCFKITFADGHIRTLPRLIKAPFRYATYAYKYLNVAKQFTTKPLKQSVISASALSMVYRPDLLEDSRIENYSRKEFLRDLIDECEKDIRLCLDAGAHVVQLDFTEARLSLKVDPSGQTLKDFISINNQVLDRFTREEQTKLGVHVCPGGDFDSCHSFDIDYTLMLPEVFQLHLNNFYLQLSSEKDRTKVLKCIKKYLKSTHRIFIGVTDPNNPQVETPEFIRDQILQASEFIPLTQLGTTDDCGFSPFADDTSTPREICYKKIQSRIQGTRLAEIILNQQRSNRLNR